MHRPSCSLRWKWISSLEITPERAILIDGAIGEGSYFHEQFGYYAQGVGPETAVLPEGWESRLVGVGNERTSGSTGWCPGGKRSRHLEVRCGPGKGPQVHGRAGALRADNSRYAPRAPRRHRSRRRSASGDRRPHRPGLRTAQVIPGLSRPGPGSGLGTQRVHLRRKRIPGEERKMAVGKRAREQGGDDYRGGRPGSGRRAPGCSPSTGRRWRSPTSTTTSARRW